MHCSFQTKRFASTASHWQFVIWFRQALLCALTYLPAMAGLRSVAHGHSLSGRVAREEPVIWVQAALTLLVFAIFWVWHTRTRPYVQKLQNQLESFLFFCSALLILLCACYTFPVEPVPALEMALTTVLLLSIATPLLFMCGCHRRLLDALGLSHPRGDSGLHASSRSTASLTGRRPTAVVWSARSAPSSTMSCASAASPRCDHAVELSDLDTLAAPPPPVGLGEQSTTGIGSSTGIGIGTGRPEGLAEIDADAPTDSDAAVEAATAAFDVSAAAIDVESNIDDASELADGHATPAVASNGDGAAMATQKEVGASAAITDDDEAEAQASAFIALVDSSESMLQVDGEARASEVRPSGIASNRASLSESIERLISFNALKRMFVSRERMHEAATKRSIPVARTAHFGPLREQWRAREQETIAVDQSAST